MKQIIFYFLVTIVMSLCLLSSSQAGVLSPSFTIGTPPPDTLVYTDGTKKVVSILNISQDVIAYKELENKVVRKIRVADIQAIKYADGSVKSFEMQADTSNVVKIIEPIGKRAFKNSIIMLVASLLSNLVIFVAPGAFFITLLISFGLLVADITCYANAIKSLRLYRKYPHKYIGKGYPTTVVVLFVLGVFATILALAAFWSFIWSGAITGMAGYFFVAVIGAILALIPAVSNHKKKRK